MCTNIRWVGTKTAKLVWKERYQNLLVKEEPMEPGTLRMKLK